jgi:hypothetical protein
MPKVNRTRAQACRGHPQHGGIGIQANHSRLRQRAQAPLRQRAAAGPEIDHHGSPLCGGFQHAGDRIEHDLVLRNKAANGAIVVRNCDAQVLRNPAFCRDRHPFAPGPYDAVATINSPMEIINRALFFATNDFSANSTDG